MKFSLSRLVSIIFVLFVLVPDISAQSDPNARDVTILSNWFEGVFDNDSQLWLEGRRDWNGQPDQKHDRINATHKRIHAPEIGNHVFYIEEFINDDPTTITRQRIVSFESSIETNEVEMKLYFLKAAEDFSLKNNLNTDFPEVKKEDLFGLDGCNVFFKRMGEQYHGSMRDQACQFGKDDLKRYSVHDLIISKNQYWRVDQSFLLSNGERHMGHPNDVPHKMRKAAHYSCDVSFHEKAYYIPSEKDKKYEGVIIHNQGGSHWFENTVNGKKYMVQLREKEYPFYAEGSDFLMLRFKEKDKLASDVIITASPGTPSISFQIGWASAHCKLLMKEE